PPYTAPTSAPRAPADADAPGAAPPDHRRAEGAGVEVDNALVHHRGALGKMGAQPDAVRVRDPHPRRHHVVHHPRELVDAVDRDRSEEHTSELQSRFDLVCRLLLEKKKRKKESEHKPMKEVEEKAGRKQMIGRETGNR